MLTTKQTALTAKPGFTKSVNFTFPGPIIIEFAGIASGVQTATLLAINTAMTTALGSGDLPGDRAKKGTCCRVAHKLRERPC